MGSSRNRCAAVKVMSQSWIDDTRRKFATQRAALEILPYDDFTTAHLRTTPPFKTKHWLTMFEVVVNYLLPIQDIVLRLLAPFGKEL
jgi:hypothetical protein